MSYLSNKAKQRFIDEMNQLNNYVLYMQENFYLRYSFIKGIDGIDGITELVEKFSFDTSSKNAVDKNYRILKKIIAQTERAISEYQSQIDARQTVARPRYTSKVRKLFDEGNFRAYEEASYLDEGQTFYEFLCELDAATEKRNIDAAPGSEEYYREYTVSDYQRAIDIMKAEEYLEESDRLERHYSWLKDYVVHFKLYDIRNPVNIYRQSFISLMAIFDATVFDLFEKMFHKDFFAIDKITEKSNKIQLSNYNSFKELQKSRIDDYLKSVYVAEVLRVMHEYNAMLFLINGVDRYDDLLELIARRNIHIHNKGIADQKYFEKGNGAQKYGIKIGKYVPIDSLYFSESAKLLESFVNNF